MKKIRSFSYFPKTFAFLLFISIISCFPEKKPLPQNQATSSDSSNEEENETNNSSLISEFLSLENTKTFYEISPNFKILFTDPSSDDQIMLETFLALINEQHQDFYLDLCLYGLSNEKIISSLENIINAGIHLRFVGNKDGETCLSLKEGNYYSGYYRLAAALDKKFPVGNKKRINFPQDYDFEDFNLINDEGTMHNKFALFTNKEGKASLFTGSTNCTESGFALNNNNALLISNADLVNSYRYHFEFLLGLPNCSPPQDLISHYVDDILLEILFAPHVQSGQNSMGHFLKKIEGATNSLHFMVFSFTDLDIYNLLINKNKNGLEVKGILDQSQLEYSSEEKFSQQGLPWKVDGNNKISNNHGGKLHHKVMIIDAQKENSLVISGSFNWTHLANYKNNENLIFIHSPLVSQIYLNEWQKRWEEGKSEEIPEGDSANYQDLIINEVMWMGSRCFYEQTCSDDEFIELKNMTNKKINLNRWLIEQAASNDKPIILNGEIEPQDFLVILKKNPSLSAFTPNKYLIIPNLSLSNNKINLVLKDVQDKMIDKAGDGSAGEDFAGFNGSGSGSLKKSMARQKNYGDGTLKENWFTTKIQVGIKNEAEYPLYNFATPGQENDLILKEYLPLDIVISEIAWAGTEVSSSNEWIELYNNTSEDISLGGWMLQGDDDGQPINIILSGIIPSQKYFLLERTDDDSVFQIKANLFFTGGFNNQGENLSLYFNDLLIDSLEMSADQEGWAAGSSQPKISMERINCSLPADRSNWQDGLGDEEGAQNSE